MEDLLECPVCMETYDVSDKRIPRVLPCQHSFCHSCIRNLVSGLTVTCPACRRRHKCTDIKAMPRNLTLLQLLEHSLSQAKTREEKKNYCRNCAVSAVFHCSCCEVDTGLCKECLIATLQLSVKQLKMKLDKINELCLTVPAMETYWNKVHQQFRTILQYCTRNARWRSEGYSPCFIEKELASLQKRSDYHYDNIEHTRAQAYLESHGSAEDMVNAIARKLGLPDAQNGELLWRYWNRRANGLSVCLNCILICLLGWLAIGYKKESACPTSPSTKKAIDYCDYCDMARSALLILIFLLALYAKVLSCGCDVVANTLHPLSVVQQIFERFRHRHNISPIEPQLRAY